MSMLVRRVFALVLIVILATVATTLVISAIARGSFQAYTVTSAEAASLKAQFSVDVPLGSTCVAGPSSALAGSMDLELLATLRMSTPSGEITLCSPKPAVAAKALTAYDLPLGVELLARTASGELQRCTHTGKSERISTPGGPAWGDSWTCARLGDVDRAALRAR